MGVPPNPKSGHSGAVPLQRKINERRMLAGQAGAVEGEAVEGAENGDGDLFGAEEFLGERLDFFAGDGFDGGEDFVEGVEAAEIELLAGEVRHARAGGLKGEHERALEVVLGAKELFFADGRFLERAEFLDGEVDDLANGFCGRAGVDGEHASVGIGRNFAEDSVSKAELFSNVLKEARGHAAAEKVVEDGDAEAAFVRNGEGRDADAKMNLLEIALGFEMDGSLRGRSGVVVIHASRFQSGKFALGKIEDALVSHVSRGGENEMVRREPILKALVQRLAAEFVHRAWSAENRPAERMIRPEAAGE